MDAHKLNQKSFQTGDPEINHHCAHHTRQPGPNYMLVTHCRWLPLKKRDSDAAKEPEIRVPGKNLSVPGKTSRKTERASYKTHFKSTTGRNKAQTKSPTGVHGGHRCASKKRIQLHRSQNVADGAQSVRWSLMLYVRAEGKWQVSPETDPHDAMEDLKHKTVTPKGVWPFSIRAAQRKDKSALQAQCVNSEQSSVIDPLHKH